MKIKNWLLILLCILVNALALAHKPGGASHFKFVENKGQWHKNVQFKCDIGNTAFYLEKNAFTFSIIDPEFAAARHSHSAKTERESANNKVLTTKGHAYKVSFVNSSDKVQMSGVNAFPEYYNFFTGKDKNKWASRVNGFTQVEYKTLYDKIDAKIYTNASKLKYDLIIHPGGDASQIKLQYDGTDKLSLKDGNLIIKTSVGQITESKPYAYYITERGKEAVVCEYVLKSNVVTYKFPQGYDPHKTLVIDPELIFSTYSGSFADNFGYTATYDSDGFLFSGSTVFSNGYPTTLGAFDKTFNGGDVDIAISKYDTTGTFMVYSTYIGGTDNELPHSIIVNSQDELFVFGTTGSTDFPVTQGAFDTTFSNPTNAFNPNLTRIMQAGLGMNYIFGCDIIVFRLGKDGDQLLASTYLGGTGNDGLNRIAKDSLFFVNSNLFFTAEPPSVDTLRYNYADEVRGEIDIDINNNIYIATCTNSRDFPIVGSSVQQNYGGGRQDGVIIKMDNNLKNILWSSYLGGSGADAIYSLSLDSKGSIYVSGGTVSKNFPVTDSAAFNSFNGGRSDGFISYIDAQGQKLLASTYYGSPEYDQIYFVERDFRDYVYVLGQTEGKDSTFVNNVKYSVPNSGQFISKFSPNLDSLKWSTAFGTGSGTPDISPTAFLVDVCRKIYLSGWGGADNQFNFLSNNAGFTVGLPITPDAFQQTTDGSDFYLMVIEDDASALSYGSFMGGPVSSEHVDGGTSRFDKKGKVYQSVCAGCGGNSDFPIEPNPGAVSATNNSFNCNNAVFKMDFKLPAVIADFDVPEIACAPFFASFKNKSLEQNATKYLWDFGDGTTSTQKQPSHLYTKAGKYTIKLKLSDVLTCNLADSLIKEIVILADTSYSLADVPVCPGQSAQIGILPNASDNVSYIWSPTTGLSDPTVPNPVAQPDASTKYMLLISNGVCTDTIYQLVSIKAVDLNTANDSIICSNDPAVKLTANSTGGANSFHWSNFPDFSDRINSDPANPTIIVVPLLAENLYFIKATNKFGCEDIDTVKVLISNYNLRVDEDKYICSGATANLKITGAAAGDTLIYDWNPKSLITGPTDTSEIVASPVVSAWYFVTAVNKRGCKFRDSVFVEVSKLTKDIIGAYADKDTIYEGTSTYIHAIPNSGYSYEWSPGSSLSNSSDPNPKASPHNTTKYNLTVKDLRADCRVDTGLTIYVIPVICDEPNIFVPNAFSPNGDNINDILYVRGSFIESIQFIIYDRWGEKVFETTDMNKGWDGTYKGMKADPAVFAYYLEVNCIGGKTFFKKGNITLLR